MSNNIQRNRNYDSGVMEAAGEQTIQVEQRSSGDDEKLDQIEVLATSKDPHKLALRNHYAGDMLLQDEFSPKNKSRGSRQGDCGNKRRAGFMSNDQFHHDEEMEEIQQRAFQQTASFAPQNRPWWLDGQPEFD